MNNKPTSRPLGAFNVHRDLIDANWRDVLPILAECFVVRAESRYDLGAIEYTALCDAFEPVELGTVPPRYQCILTKGEDGKISVKWEKEPA